MMKKYGVLILVCMLFSSAAMGQDFEFNPIGTIDVNPGEVVIFQIEEGTPGDPGNMTGVQLELDPTVKSGIVMRTLTDGRTDEFPDFEDVKFTLDIQQSGTYYVFAKVYATSGGDDSFFTGFDDNIGNGDDWRNNTETRNSWAVEWVTSQSLDNGRVEFDLSAGEHVLHWHNRETDALVDWIGITDNPDLDLSQVEEPGDPVPIVTGRRILGRSLFEPGDEFPININVENVGGGSASVDVVETLPTDVTVSEIGQGGAEADGVITWSLADITADSNITLSYKVAVPSGFSGDSLAFSGQITGAPLGDVDIGGGNTMVMPNEVGIFQGMADWDRDDGTKAAGSATFADGTYNLEGNGNDIWQSADEGLFIFSDKKGSWSLTGRVFWNDPGTNEWSKVGVMVRENGPMIESRHYWIELRGSGLGDRTDAQWRDSEGGASGNTEIEDQNGDPVIDLGEGLWLRVTRLASIDTFVSEFSFFGEEWFTAHSMTQENWPDIASYGLAITSHTDDDALVAAQVFDVELNPVAVATRTLSQEIFSPGDSLEVTLDVMNDTDESIETTVTETLSEGFSASNVSDGGSASGNEVNWSLNLDPGSSKTLTYTIDAPADANRALSISGKAGQVPTQGAGSVILTMPAPEGDPIFDLHADIYDTYENLGADGGVEYDASTGTYTMWASGADVWNEFDQFHFLFTEVNGDFTFQARGEWDFEAHSTSTNDWIKMMLMARDNLSPGSPNFATRVRRDGQFSWQYRENQDASSSSTPGDDRITFGNIGILEDEWLMRLDRVGDVFTTMYWDPIDKAWVQVGDAIERVLENPIYVGLAMTSHEAGAMQYATFSDVELEAQTAVWDWMLME
ncbi:DUF11 domain-containing protein [bacterium]|nr:DUF11 domain-containing protein [bacterium]